MLYFEWDPNKAAKNKQMHGIDFLAARVALEDPYAIEEPDQTVEGEPRLRTTGMADGQVVVLVSHTNRPGDQEGDEIARIIHARKASPGERREYDKVRARGGGYTFDR